MRMSSRAAIVAAFLVVGCASVPRPDPTPDHPRVGCRVDSVGGPAMRVEGKLLPAVVRVIGTYEHNQDEWKVLLPGEQDVTKWVPIQKSLIRFVGCGSEVDAFNEVFSNSAERQK
jgi:hypothetical protein